MSRKFYWITDELSGSWEDLEEQERENEKKNVTQRFMVATKTSEKFKDSLPKFIYVFKKENTDKVKQEFDPNNNNQMDNQSDTKFPPVFGKIKKFVKKMNNNMKVNDPTIKSYAADGLESRYLPETIEPFKEMTVYIEISDKIQIPEHKKEETYEAYIHQLIEENFGLVHQNQLFGDKLEFDVENGYPRGHINVNINDKTMTDNPTLFTVKFFPIVLKKHNFNLKIKDAMNENPANFDLWKIYKYTIANKKLLCDGERAYFSIRNMLIDNNRLPIKKSSLAKKFFKTSANLPAFVDRLILITLFHIALNNNNNRKFINAKEKLAYCIHYCFELWQDTKFWNEKKRVMQYFSLIFYNDFENLEVFRDNDWTILDLLIMNMSTIADNMRDKKLMTAVLRAYLRKVQSVNLCHACKIGV